MPMTSRVPLLLVLTALLLAVALVTTQPAEAQEAGALGRVVLTMGRSGSNYGYDSGSYGTLDSGRFPGDLFGDGNERAIAEFYEDNDGYWYLTYSGGAANDWNVDDEHLNEILIEVEYSDGVDTRSFVLGGFISDRPGSRGLKLDPPIPSRDWNSRNGQEVAITFTRHTSQAVRIVPEAIAPPSGRANSLVEFISDTTPGGPVMAQTLIVLLVYTFLIIKCPSTPRGLIGCAIALILTPWGPVVLGFGDQIAAVIIFVNVAAGAYAYKAYVDRTQA